MSRVRIGLVLAALFVSAGAAEAQLRVAARDVPPGQRPPRGMCRIWIDGVPPGRQPRPTSCAVAEANRPANARVIYGDDTPFPGRARGRFDRECTFERTSTIAGIIFGRRDGELECRATGPRQLGAWYEVGRNRNGDRIYQRRVRLADGTIVVQRARRTRNGSLVLSGVRYPRAAITARNTDEEWWTSAARRRPRQSRRAQGRPAVSAPGLDVARERVQGTPAEPVIERVRDDVREQGRGRDGRRGPPNQSSRRDRGRP